jgi:hypothetical protein
MQSIAFVLHNPDGRLREEDGPLEWCTVQTLALFTVAVLRIERVAVNLECNWKYGRVLAYGIQVQ